MGRGWRVARGRVVVSGRGVCVCGVGVSVDLWVGCGVVGVGAGVESHVGPVAQKPSLGSSLGQHIPPFWHMKDPEQGGLRWPSKHSHGGNGSQGCGSQVSGPDSGLHPDL